MSDLFDKIVREKLQDAKMPVPRGAWQNISCQLEQQKTNYRAGAWMWGMAMSLCACVAGLAIVLFGPTQRLKQTDAGRVEVVKIVGGEKELAFECETIDTNVKVLRAIMRPSLDVAVEFDKEPVTERSVETVEEKKLSSNSDISTQSEWEDPFAIMMAQDAAASALKREKPSIKVGGVIGANDSHFGALGSRPRWTSGHTYNGVNEEQSVSNYAVPLSVGASVRFPLSDRFSLSLGLNWSSLSRTFKGTYNTVDGDVTHNVQYIGVPINLYYNIVQNKYIQIYSYVGASAEKCISSKYYFYSESTLPLISEKIDELQWGLKIGVGSSFNINPNISLYFDPYVAYFAKSFYQPKSIRTEYPLMVSFEAGIRFNL